MKKKPVTSVIYNFLMSLSFASFVAFVLSWPLLVIFINVQKTYQIVNMSVWTIMKNYSQLLIYLISPFTKKLSMSDFPTSSSAAEHFYECKLLFQLALIVLIVGIIIYFYLKRRKKLSYISLSRNAAIAFMINPLVVLPFALMNFDSFFITFHHLLFNNNNWLFDPATDPIINVLTEEFFAGCFGVGGILYELYFARFLFKHKKRNSI